MADMASRSRISVADLFRGHFAGYRSRHRLRLEEHRAVQPMMLCRTERLGRYESRCANGHVAFNGFHACHHRRLSAPHRRCAGGLARPHSVEVADRAAFPRRLHLTARVAGAVVPQPRQAQQSALPDRRREPEDPAPQSPHLGAEPAMLLAQHT